MMSTPFQSVYDSFLMKVEDYSFLNLTQEDLESDLENYLNISSAKFRVCKKDLSDKNLTTKEFNVDLSIMEIEILSSLMVVEYLKPQITTSNLLKQKMTDKDFKIYSQGNHLDQLMKLYKQMKHESQSLINDYSFYSNSLDDLK